MLLNDIITIFHQYQYNNPESNASNLDKYLRALAQCMLDHADQELTFDLVKNIFSKTEFYSCLEYDSEWEKLIPNDDENEEELSCEAAVLHIKGLAADNRKKKLDYQERFAKFKAQYPDPTWRGLPFYQYNGAFAYWNNFSLISILDILETYLLGSHGMTDVLVEMEADEINWYLFPEFLIIGIGYE